MRPERGSVILELALAASLLVALLAGATQFGYAFWVYGQLQNAVRNGARYASTRPYCAGRDREAVRNVVVYGVPEPAPGAAPVVRGLETGHVAVASKRREVTVTITDFSVDSVFSTYTFRGKPLAAAPVTGECRP